MYLCISRKNSESVIATIGTLRIEVKVLEVRGDKVKLGFAAPRDVRIHREEIQRERDAAACVAASDPGDPNGEDFA